MSLESCGCLSLPGLLFQNVVRFIQEKVEKLVCILVHVAAEQLVVTLDTLHKPLWLDDAGLFLLGADLLRKRRDSSKMWRALHDQPARISLKALSTSFPRPRVAIVRHRATAALGMACKSTGLAVPSCSSMYCQSFRVQSTFPHQEDPLAPFPALSWLPPSDRQRVAALGDSTS